MLTAHLNNLVAQNVSWKFHKISDFFQSSFNNFSIRMSPGFKMCSFKQFLFY